MNFQREVCLLSRVFEINNTEVWVHPDFSGCNYVNYVLCSSLFPRTMVSSSPLPALICWYKPANCVRFRLWSTYGLYLGHGLPSWGIDFHQVFSVVTLCALTNNFNTLPVTLILRPVPIQLIYLYKFILVYISVNTMYCPLLKIRDTCLRKFHVTLLNLVIAVFVLFH